MSTRGHAAGGCPPVGCEPAPAPAPSRRAAACWVLSRSLSLPPRRAAQTSRPSGALRPPAWLASPPVPSTHSRRPGRRRAALEVRLHRLLEVLERRPPLRRARRQGRPHPLAEPPARLPARPLGHHPVDHHEPDRLLRQVVRRTQPRRGEEREVVLAVLRQPLRHRLAGLRLRHLLLAGFEHRRLGLLQPPGELLGGPLLPPGG